MHHGAFGPVACESGAVDGGVLRLRRRGVTRPLRRKMSAKVLSEGNGIGIGAQ
jgi:hypothetical protein